MTFFVDLLWAERWRHLDFLILLQLQLNLLFPSLQGILHNYFSWKFLRNLIFVYFLYLFRDILLLKLIIPWRICNWIFSLIYFRCVIVMSTYVSSTDVLSVMWYPLDSVTTCCFVHFTIGPSYFLHGLTVCPWVLIDFATFGPTLLLSSPRARKV